MRGLMPDGGGLVARVRQCTHTARDNKKQIKVSGSNLSLPAPHSPETEALTN